MTNYQMIVKLVKINYQVIANYQMIALSNDSGFIKKIK